jgi:hypothetical protein
MVEGDLMAALRDSYREVQSRKIRFRSPSGLSSLRRNLTYIVDVLDIILSIQRDRRWRHNDWED